MKQAMYTLWEISVTRAEMLGMGMHSMPVLPAVTLDG